MKTITCPNCNGKGYTFRFLVNCDTCDGSGKVEAKKLSNCHQAPVELGTANEGTSYYVCSRCQKPCDPWVEAKEAKRKQGKPLRARMFDFCHENGAISEDRPTIVQIRLDRLVTFVEQELLEDTAALSPQGESSQAERHDAKLFGMNVRVDDSVDGVEFHSPTCQHGKPLEPNPKPIETEGELEKILIDLYQDGLEHGEIQANGVGVTALTRERTILIAKGELGQLIAREREAAVREEVEAQLKMINDYKPDPTAPSFGSASGAMERQGWKRYLEKRIAELKGTQPHE